MLMLQDEADNIAAPASRIAARHIPIPGGAGAATDLNDVLALVVACGGYVMRGLARRAAALTGHTLGTEKRKDAGEPEPNQIEPPPTLATWPGPARPALSGLT